MSISCGCMDMLLIFLTLILLTRFSQRGNLMSAGGQWADHIQSGRSRLIGISRDGDGPGICLVDGQTEATGVQAESGNSDALLPYLTCSHT